MTQVQLINDRATIALRAITYYEPGTLRAYVAQQALDYSDIDPTTMFFDLTKGGCQAGVIPDLIHYADTYAFFEQFYYEIDDLRLEIEESTGQPIRIEGGLKNGLAWFAFETVAMAMAREDLELAL